MTQRVEAAKTAERMLLNLTAFDSADYFEFKMVILSQRIKRTYYSVDIAIGIRFQLRVNPTNSIIVIGMACCWIEEGLV